MSHHQDPHGDQPTLTAGRPLGEAAAAMILLHGRGASAEDILGLADALDRPDFAYIAPQAAAHTWYPYGFMTPIAQNQPWLDSALALLGATLEATRAGGIAPERMVLLGFSQGACLTLEFCARHARRYGGIAALTGGLIGPDGTPRDYPGSLAGTPVFIGSANPDPHIPVTRVHESARVLEELGAQVTTQIYPGMGHTVSVEELKHVRALMDALTGS